MKLRTLPCPGGGVPISSPRLRRCHSISQKSENCGNKGRRRDESQKSGFGSLRISTLAPWCPSSNRCRQDVTDVQRPVPVVIWLSLRSTGVTPGSHGRSNVSLPTTPLFSREVGQIGGKSKLTYGRDLGHALPVNGNNMISAA